MKEARKNKIKKSKVKQRMYQELIQLDLISSNQKRKKYLHKITNAMQNLGSLYSNFQVKETK